MNKNYYYIPFLYAIIWNDEKLSQPCNWAIVQKQTKLLFEAQTRDGPKTRYTITCCADVK